ncbi:hypothetical protein BDZ94DRAFT_1260359 [Collybia nuda]|uniref:Uncharacterized protein n=1 Tax=Collybia nuda TaxID=64659 RepID=A0A9P5Y5S6_9AGAR|nr:hypothetical protein BDZ94DRAFT_1260359 [Collybia nuda]
MGPSTMCSKELDHSTLFVLVCWTVSLLWYVSYGIIRSRPLRSARGTGPTNYLLENFKRPIDIFTVNITLSTHTQAYRRAKYQVERAVRFR